MTEDDIIGYQLTGKTLLPIRRHKRGTSTTPITILCAQCGGTISLVGGPRWNALCGWPCIRKFLSEKE